MFEFNLPKTLIARASHWYMNNREGWDADNSVIVLWTDEAGKIQQKTFGTSTSVWSDAQAWTNARDYAHGQVPGTREVIELAGEFSFHRGRCEYRDHLPRDIPTPEVCKTALEAMRLDRAQR